MKWLFPLLVITASAMAAEPPLSPFPKGEVKPFEDAKLAAKIKNALANEPAVAKANLFVTSHQGQITIQGPLADQVVGERIRAIVAAVPGVVSVTLDFFEIQGKDPLEKAIADRLNPKPVDTLKESPIVPLPGSLPSLAMGPTATTKQREILSQRPDEPALPPLPMTIEPLPPAPLTPRPYPTIASPNVPIIPQATTVSRSEIQIKPLDQSPEEIAFALIELRKSDRRFQRLTATIVDGLVTVTGQSDGLSEFVSQVKTWPGVSGVKTR